MNNRQAWIDQARGIGARIRLIGHISHQKMRSLYRRFVLRGKRYRPKKICGHKVFSAEMGNKKLMEMIQSGKPFAAVRYGGTEMSTYIEAKKYALGLKKDLSQSVIDDMQRQSGFFPNDVALMPRYAQVVEETSREVDFLATYATPYENYMVSSFMGPDLFVSDNRALEPFYFQHNHPWSKALEGKRVLVIHPFEDSIKKQYAIRQKLFSDPEVLPEFELHTLKAVQTIVGTKDDRFETWFDALEYMYQEAMKIPFDIALLGCGAYGQPLACMLKRAGKQAIHIGGATQILFGIIGKRWELNSKEVSAMFNEHWIRPSVEETPVNKSANEFGGAYW